MFTLKEIGLLSGCVHSGLHEATITYINCPGPVERIAKTREQLEELTTLAGKVRAMYVTVTEQRLRFQRSLKKICEEETKLDYSDLFVNRVKHADAAQMVKGQIERAHREDRASTIKAVY